jgi:hypothetical protein
MWRCCRTGTGVTVVVEDAKERGTGWVDEGRGVGVDVGEEEAEGEGSGCAVYNRL